MIKSFLFLVLATFSVNAFAATHCLCEMGDNNVLACDFWLAKKSCTTRKTLKRNGNRPLLSYLPKLAAGDKVEVGYVGPWSGHGQTLEYIEQQLIPIIEKKAITISFDNMADFSLEDPDFVQEYFNAINIQLPAQIAVSGLQTGSVGIWNNLFWGHAELQATAKTDAVIADYTKCNAIEGKYCSSNQLNDTGRCLDTNINRCIWLTCRRSNSLFGGYNWQRQK